MFGKVHRVEGVSRYKFYDPNTCTVILSCSPHFLELTCFNPNHTQSHSDITGPDGPSNDDEINVTSDTEHTLDFIPPPILPSPPSHLASPPVPPPPSSPLPLSLDEAPFTHTCALPF